MQNHERTPISRDGLLTKFLEERRLGCFSFIPLAVIGAIALFVTIFFISEWPQSSAEFRICAVITLVILWGIALISQGFLTVPTLRIRSHLRKGHFSLVEDKVVGMAEETVRGGRTTVKVFYFQKYGRAPVNSALWVLVSEGDTLYVAVLHGKTDQIMGVYHPLMYRRTDERPDGR